MKKTFEEIEKDNSLIYKYLRGSHCHGTAIEGVSDYDYGGVFVSSNDTLLGLGFDYQDQVANETNDIVWYELNKFMNLLIKSNPTVLEALFVDDKYVIKETETMKMIKSHRDKFLTKKCFGSFFNYSKSQIKKARGLNKKINWTVTERKEILDFVYTFHGQGSTKLINWLDNHGLKQQYCGLVNIPNMPTIYGLYYDWGNHFLSEGFNYQNLVPIVCDILNPQYVIENDYEVSDVIKICRTIIETYGIKSLVGFNQWYDTNTKPIGYKGIVNEKHTSNELRLSSVSKGEKPITYITYSENSYTQHCRMWKEYQDWKKKRNPIRYESNLNKSYDAKNMSECFRLVNCGIEIARGEGFKVDRSGIDADFLLDVKQHKYEYEQLMEMLETKTQEMEKAMEESTIPEDIDCDFVNGLVLDIRKQHFK